MNHKEAQKLIERIQENDTLIHEYTKVTLDSIKRADKAWFVALKDLLKDQLRQQTIFLEALSEHVKEGE